MYRVDETTPGGKREEEGEKEVEEVYDNGEDYGGDEDDALEEGPCY